MEIWGGGGGEGEGIVCMIPGGAKIENEAD